MNQDNPNSVVEGLVEQGRDIVHKASQRHVIIRRADGSQLADVSVPIVVIAIAAMFFLQPIGSFVAIGSIIYGIVNKLKIEVIHEVSQADDVVEMNISHDEQ